MLLQKLESVAIVQGVTKYKGINDSCVRFRFEDETGRFLTTGELMISSDSEARFFGALIGRRVQILIGEVSDP